MSKIQDPVFITVSNIQYQFSYDLLNTVIHQVPDFGTELEVGDPEPVYNDTEDNLIEALLQTATGYVEALRVGPGIDLYFKRGHQPKSLKYRKLPAKVRRQYALVTERYEQEVADIFKKHYGDNVMTASEMDQLMGDFAITVNDYRRELENQPDPEPETAQS